MVAAAKEMIDLLGDETSDCEIQPPFAAIVLSLLIGKTRNIIVSVQLAVNTLCMNAQMTA